MITCQQPIRFQARPLTCLTGPHGHCFFGYYDLQPWSADGRRHLAHRVSFMDRLPDADDQAEMGTIDGTTGHFTTLATTAAWNFQQGAMLQWNPRRPDEEIIYNARHDGAFGAVIHNLISGQKRFLSRPVATVATAGTTALSINFSRMLDFRPGYGYAGIPDPYAGVPAPEDDGIYRLDLVSGAVAQILSLAELRERFAAHFGAHLRGAKVLVNHITLNPSATRFLFLLRSMPMPGQPANGWLTMVATADVDGRNVHVFNGHGGASHYCWRGDRHILIYADLPGGGDMQLCLVEDQTQRFDLLDRDVFGFDGHCSYSPDQRFLLYDSYPDATCYRKLLVYDIARRRAIPLAELYSVRTAEDARCDLHPRWSRDGSFVSFDSTHEGVRGVYTMDVREICHA